MKTINNEDKVLKTYQEQIDFFYGEISNHDHKGSACNCSEWYDGLAEAIRDRDLYLEEEYGELTEEAKDPAHLLTANDVL